MGSKLYRDQVCDAALAALAGLETAVKASSEAPTAVLAAVLERTGDLQRLQQPPPPWCTPYLRTTSEADLGRVLSAYLGECSRWPVPEDRVDLTDTGQRSASGPVDNAASAADEDRAPSHGALALALGRRDEIESARMVLTQLTLKRGHAPVLLDGWSELAGALHAWQSTLSAVLDRGGAELLLAERVALSARHSWLMQLPEAVAENAAADNSGTSDSFVRVYGGGEPDDTCLDGYLRSGELQRYVEGYAASSPTFAETLAETISSLRDVGELGTALAPRRWLKHYEKRAHEPTALSLPRGRLAAADRPLEPEPDEIDLGAIAGLATAVNASLRVTGRRVLLIVDADGELREVRLGGAVARSAAADGSWQAEATLDAGPLRIRIEDCRGGVFEDVLALDTER